MCKLGPETCSKSTCAADSYSRRLNRCSLIKHPVCCKCHNLTIISANTTADIRQVISMCCFQGADNTTVSFNNFVIQEDTRDLLQFTVGAATIVSNETTSTRGATSKHITNRNGVITRCKVDSSIHLWIKEPHVILVYLINLDLDNTSTTDLVTDDCVRYTDIPVIIQFDNLICIRHTFTS